MSMGIFIGIRNAIYTNRFYLLLAALIMNFFIPALKLDSLADIIYRILQLLSCYYPGQILFRRKKINFEASGSFLVL
jgi:hypothetical protein